MGLPAFHRAWDWLDDGGVRRASGSSLFEAFVIGAVKATPNITMLELTPGWQ
ncbi:hypothetical protein [Chelativorans sp. Marseille-P2723]|uniref:hypothetical protein n=1 Tax=Chelativorans sp. Marseille-P2723 TaxID=2709133 RepID=UPI00156F9893|nr:hypothetical protein [Chelativorans sp. Marseille-P2723]